MNVREIIEAMSTRHERMIQARRVNALLATPDKDFSAGRAPKPRTPGALLYDFWSKLYREKFGRSYPDSVKDRTLLKKLLRTYSPDDIRAVISEYITNHRRFTYIQGYPSIGAMSGFKTRLFPDVLFGGLTPIGQSSDRSSRTEEEAWGSNYYGKA